MSKDKPNPQNWRKRLSNSFKALKDKVTKTTTLDQNDIIDSLDTKTVVDIMNDQLSSGVQASDDLKKYVIDRIFTDAKKCPALLILAFLQAFISQYKDMIIQFIGDTKIESNYTLMKSFVNTLSKDAKTLGLSDERLKFILQPFTDKLEEYTNDEVASLGQCAEDAIAL